jgi:hypothetical protein
MQKFIDFLKARFHQEGTLIIILIAGLIGFFIMTHGNKQVNKPDFGGATFKDCKVSVGGEIKKRLIPFIEAFGGIATNGDSRAEVGARVGVRWEW